MATTQVSRRFRFGIAMLFLSSMKVYQAYTAFARTAAPWDWNERSERSVHPYLQVSRTDRGAVIRCENIAHSFWKGAVSAGNP